MQCTVHLWSICIQCINNYCEDLSAGRVDISGGSRVGCGGCKNPFLLASELKNKALKQQCAHFQYLIKITKLILDEVRHPAEKLQTRDQLRTEWFTQHVTERIATTRQDIYNLFDF